MNYYELLGVRIDATPMEIEAAYQTVTKSTGLLKDPIRDIELFQAYQTVMDPYSRLQYDKECAFGHRRVQQEGERDDGRKIDLVVYDENKAKESQKGYQERVQMNMPMQVNHNYYNRTSHYGADTVADQGGFTSDRNMQNVVGYYMYFAIGISVVTMVTSLIF